MIVYDYTLKAHCHFRCSNFIFISRYHSSPHNSTMESISQPATLKPQTTIMSGSILMLLLSAKMAHVLSPRIPTLRHCPARFGAPVRLLSNIPQHGSLNKAISSFLLKRMEILVKNSKL